ncbi:GIY-YIG nuclease family protein [Candidatus Woesebacteria bacterium]|nr:GIY-YIG nuclease family protein [Candidatus Woesebacteria bacterium]
MYYIYILFSEVDKKLYTGFTDNLRSRFKAHTDILTELRYKNL